MRNEFVSKFMFSPLHIVLLLGRLILERVDVRVRGDGLQNADLRVVGMYANFVANAPS